MSKVFDEAVLAIIDGDAVRLRELLTADPSLITARSSSDHRSTLLHYVAANGIENELQRTPPNAVEIAEILLGAGAEVNALAETYGGGPNQTTLNLLVSSVHPAKARLQGKLARLLLDAGAPPNGLEDDGSPLDTALFFGYVKTARVLADNGARVDKLTFAAGLGEVDRLRALLGKDDRFTDGENLTHQDSIERAFIYACMNDQAEAAAFLLGLGVDINVMRKDIHANPCTGLHFAAWLGRTSITRLLVERGADLNVRDPNIGATPRGWAKHNGHEKVVAMLVEAGAE